MTSRYSLGALIAHGLRGQRHWRPVWRSPEPRDSYDAVIIGGGGHGLAAAYFLAKRHGIRNVAVIEKGWLGGGNSGRNTQVTRSNYFYPQSTAFYEHSLKLYEGLSRELNLNVMLSQRGVLNLALSRHEFELQRRWANAILLNGVDSEIVSRAEIERLEPTLRLDSRYRVWGGFVQRRAGISRHDAVNWGFARGASALGVDIIQNCAVTDFEMQGGRIAALHTSRGRIGAGRVLISAAGDSAHLARLAGVRLPLSTMALQAMVSEPVKPTLNTVVFAPAIQVYVSQSDRGELVIGGAADVYNSYARRGSLPVMEEVVRALLELFPHFGRLRLMRQWAGAVDITPDTSPLMGATPVRNLFVNCGWGTGGYKAIPAGGETMAHTLAHGTPHPLIEPFGIDRFERGALIDEGAASGVAH